MVLPRSIYVYACRLFFRLIALLFSIKRENLYYEQYFAFIRAFTLTAGVPTELTAMPLGIL